MPSLWNQTHGWMLMCWIPNFDFILFLVCYKVMLKSYEYSILDTSSHFAPKWCQMIIPLSIFFFFFMNCPYSYSFLNICIFTLFFLLLIFKIFDRIWVYRSTILLTLDLLTHIHIQLDEFANIKTFIMVFVIFTNNYYSINEITLQ